MDKVQNLSNSESFWCHGTYHVKAGKMQTWKKCSHNRSLKAVASWGPPLIHWANVCVRVKYLSDQTTKESKETTYCFYIIGFLHDRDLKICSCSKNSNVMNTPSSSKRLNNFKFSLKIYNSIFNSTSKYFSFNPYLYKLASCTSSTAYSCPFLNTIFIYSLNPT
jgi:hypothetical protein